MTSSASPIDTTNAYLQSLVGSGFLSGIPSALLTGLGLFAVSGAAQQIASNVLASTSSPTATGGLASAVVNPQPVVAARAVAERLGPMAVPTSWAQPPAAATPLTPSPAAAGGGARLPVGLPVVPAVPVTGGKGGKKRARGIDPDEYEIGVPLKAKPLRHPSGG